MLPAEVSGYVPCHDVGFEVDDRAAFVATGDGHLEGVRYQSHLERARWLVQLRHGEADAVHSDGALDGDEPREGAGQHDGEAASVDRDAAADLQPARDPGVIDADPAAVGLDHLGDGANYPGEHPRIP